MPRSKQYRAWVFTLNNYTQLEEDELKLLDESKGVRYIVFGKEIGSNACTPHLQGYIYMTGKFTMQAMKARILALKRSHLEPRRGSHEEARSYCMKEGDVFEKGIPPKSSSNNSSSISVSKLNSKRLYDLAEEGEISIYSIPTLYKAKCILMNEQEPLLRGDVCGVWIHGPPGVGKSHVAHTLFPEAFIKQQNKWFDGYEGQETILLDDLDSSVLGHLLKIWTDRWPCRGEIKGGTVPLRHKRFIITSNYTPHQLWSEDIVLAEAIQRRMTMWKISKRY